MCLLPAARDLHSTQRCCRIPGTLLGQVYAYQNHGNNLCLLNGRHRRSERRYQKQQQNELLQAHQQSQQDFWGQLGKTGIGQERKPQLPNGVRIDDVIHTDAEAILNKWERDFAELFSEQSNSFDDNHLIFVKNRLHEI